MYNNTEATKGVVWTAAETVWNSASSSDVACAFVLAYRIMRHIIAENGFNHWLSEGTPHCNVRQVYYDTPTGIRPKRVVREEV